MAPLARGEGKQEAEEAAGKGGVECLEVKDRVVSLQAVLTRPDPALEAAIQNRYSRSRSGSQEIHTSTARS